MESNKIAVLDNKLPIKAYPEPQLDKILNTSFKFWLASLLSIKADNEDKLDFSLDAVKKYFWSLGIDEIKKAFEMYAGGELITKPISNHIDYILVGQIFKEYKEQKPIIKKTITETEISEDEKKALINSGMTKCLEHYEKETQILDGYNHFMYDVLADDGYLPIDKQTKLQALEDAKIITEMELEQKPASSLKEFKEIKQTLEKIQNDESLKLITKAKELMVLKFLRGVIKDAESFNQLKQKYDTKIHNP